MSRKKPRCVKTKCHSERILMVACTHVNEGKRCGVKKWCPVILNGAFGGVKDLRYGTGTVILNRVKDLGHGMMVTFITDEYVEVYQILRCRSE